MWRAGRAVCVPPAHPATGPRHTGALSVGRGFALLLLGRKAPSLLLWGPVLSAMAGTKGTAASGLQMWCFGRMGVWMCWCHHWAGPDTAPGTGALQCILPWAAAGWQHPDPPWTLGEMLGLFAVPLVLFNLPPSSLRGSSALPSPGGAVPCPQSGHQRGGLIL